MCLPKEVGQIFEKVEYLVSKVENKNSCLFFCSKYNIKPAFRDILKDYLCNLSWKFAKLTLFLSKLFHILSRTDRDTLQKQHRWASAICQE